MSEFSDRDFVAGSLIGTRTWRIDNYGRLAAVTVGAFWTPGVNEAKCLKGEYATGGMLSQMITFTLGSGNYLVPSPIYTAAPAPEPESAPENHMPGSLRCQCGYYAYFTEASNPYHVERQGVIEGIVEGYGLVTVGTKGFRAQRARIVALVVPPEDFMAPMEWVKGNYPEAEVFQDRAEAFRAHPLTVPAPEKTPESDPDFWTRPVAFS